MRTLTALLVLCACSKSEPQHAPAPKSVLIVYCGRAEQLMNGIFAGFEYENGVDLQVRYADSARLTSLLVEEGAATKADVFLAQDVASLAALDEKGLLAPLPEEVLKVVSPSWRSPTGTWIGTSGRARTLVYNPQKVTTVPAIAELGDARWKGKIGWAPATAAFQAFIAAMIAEDGEDKTAAWLKAVQANQPRAFPTNTPLVVAVGRGELDVGLSSHYHLYGLRVEHPELKAENHFYRNGRAESLVSLSGAAVLASSPAPRAAVAQKLIAYLLEVKAQEKLSAENQELPTRAGMPPSKVTGLPDIDTLKPPAIPAAALGKLDRAAALIKEAGAFGTSP